MQPRNFLTLRYSLLFGLGNAVNTAEEECYLFFLKQINKWTTVLAGQLRLYRVSQRLDKLEITQEIQAGGWDRRTSKHTQIDRHCNL